MLILVKILPCEYSGFVEGVLDSVEEVDQFCVEFVSGLGFVSDPVRGRIEGLAAKTDDLWVKARLTNIIANFHPIQHDWPSYPPPLCEYLYNPLLPHPATPSSRSPSFHCHDQYACSKLSFYLSLCRKEDPLACELKGTGTLARKAGMGKEVVQAFGEVVARAGFSRDRERVLVGMIAVVKEAGAGEVFAGVAFKLPFLMFRLRMPDKAALVV
jgi:hypothetical protein